MGNLTEASGKTCAGKSTEERSLTELPSRTPAVLRIDAGACFKGNLTEAGGRIRIGLSSRTRNLVEDGEQFTILGFPGRA
jgi:hypothetical protein